MRERAGELCGHVGIDSPAGGGTLVTLAQQLALDVVLMDLTWRA